MRDARSCSCSISPTGDVASTWAAKVEVVGLDAFGL
jgi:hypothetical protein